MSTPSVLVYRSADGVDAYVRAVSSATPMEIVEIERLGVQGSFIKDLSKRMDVATSRIFTILGVPKATAEKKAAAGERVTGRGGQAAVGMIRLLGIAQGIADNSTAQEARGFDAAQWLGQWIERPNRLPQIDIRIRVEPRGGPQDRFQAALAVMRVLASRLRAANDARVR